MQETQETWVRSLGWEDPLEEGVATHSGILAWKIPWTKEPGWLQPIVLQRVQTWLRASLSLSDKLCWISQVVVITCCHLLCIVRVLASIINYIQYVHICMCVYMYLCIHVCKIHYSISVGQRLLSPLFANFKRIICLDPERFGNLAMVTMVTQESIWCHCSFHWTALPPSAPFILTLDAWPSPPDGILHSSVVLSCF